MTETDSIETPSGKLPLAEKIAYGFGDLASVLYWQTFMLYLTYFYTDVFFIPAILLCPDSAEIMLTETFTPELKRGAWYIMSEMFNFSKRK